MEQLSRLHPWHDDMLKKVELLCDEAEQVGYLLLTG